MAELSTIHAERLFEVRILHEFYLNKDSSASYFSLDSATRASYLDNLLQNNGYDIRKDLIIEPAGETGKILENHHLRFVRTGTGFMIGVKVKQESGKNYPFLAPAINTPLTFRLQISNPGLKNFTNLPLNPATPAVFLFSNSNREGTKVFPSLSVPVDQFRNGRSYELGELAMMGNDIMEAITPTSSASGSDWRNIQVEGIAHEGDRMLLPLRFRYKFRKDTGIRQAEFTLKTTEGTTLKTISISGEVQLDKVILDFSSNDSSVRNEIGKGFYILEVRGENGYFHTERIMLDPGLYDNRDLGIVEINYRTGDGLFDLLEPDGSIKALTPVFEIRLKSRITFWRYRSNLGIRLKATDKTSPYLIAENGILKSVRPLPMNARPLEFMDETLVNPGVFLPNPHDQSLRVENNGMIYSDIYVSGIKDLIVEDI